MTETTNLTDKPLKPVVITDLDGTLLDQQTYSYQGSSNAILKLLSLKIPLVLCSSKTRSEMVPLWQELGLPDPFIVENGGGLCLPVNYFPFPIEELNRKGSLDILDLGRNISVIRTRLAETAHQCGVRVKSFSTMGAEEIARLTGLNRTASLLAARREYDEPFIVEEGNRYKLYANLRGQGFEVTEGDRFSHLTGGHDKGKAVSILLDFYRRSGHRILSVGLGNSANDGPLLKEVDRPVVIRHANGTWDAEIMKAFPHAQRTQGIGPVGWTEAIQEILASVDLSLTR